MSRIALVGCPKSGKTKLAKLIKEDLKVGVVDNIAQKFSKATNLEIGLYGDYRVNLALAGIRWQHELTNEDYVQTTTILDSIFYTLEGIEIFEMKEGNEPDDMFLSPYYFTSLYLINFFRDSWKFDKTIFLPYHGKSTEWIGMDDIYLRMLEGFGIKYETLNE